MVVSTTTCRNNDIPRVKLRHRYAECGHSNLNGFNFNAKSMQPGKGIIWRSWRGMKHSLRATQMALMPKGTDREGDTILIVDIIAMVDPIRMVDPIPMVVPMVDTINMVDLLAIGNFIVLGYARSFPKLHE